MRDVLKRFCCLAAMMLVVCMLMSTAFAAETDAFTFALSADGQGYIVTGYTGNEASVTVPDWYHGLPVTEIGDGAFQGNTVITKVSLPSTVTVIGAAAFKNCTALSALSSYTASAEPPVVEPEPPVAERVPGDADGDGYVDIMDALAILQYDVGWDVEINVSNSDVDGSGYVDIMDALLILQYDVGWDVELL